MRYLSIHIPTFMPREIMSEIIMELLTFLNIKRSGINVLVKIISQNMYAKGGVSIL